MIPALSSNARAPGSRDLAASSKDRPIIFSGPMVRALLAGTKTQTRRVLKLPTKTRGPDSHAIYERKDMGGWEPTTNGGGATFTIGRDGSRVPCPETVGIWHRTCGVCLDAPYQAGDRLYVRENFAYVGSSDPGYLTYQATYPGDLAGLGMENVPATLKEAGYKWTPCIHMPRAVSRLTLLVTHVKIERLQDISKADVMAEGVTERHGEPLSECVAGWHEPFADLWASINGPTAWDENPFVVAVSFDVVRANIDQAPALSSNDGTGGAA